MDYKLAKELKEAGYPQKGLWGIAFFPEKSCWTHSKVKYTRKEHYRTFPWKSAANFFKSPYEPIVKPTLSELIESCGDKFFQLTRSDEKLWSASDIHHYRYDYHSPDEAVAKLWLALNQK